MIKRVSVKSHLVQNLVQERFFFIEEDKTKGSQTVSEDIFKLGLVSQKQSKKVILAGGTGEIGKVLEREYLERGYQVLILTRTPKKKHHLYWDGERLDSWFEELEHSDLLINLSGHSILSGNRSKIYNSRINSTKVLGEALARLSYPPKVWLQMSATGIYAHRLEGFDDEFEGKVDQGDSSDFWKFMSKLIQDWESTFYSSSTPFTRKIVMRMSFFMSTNKKGFFGTCSSLSKKGLGGSLGGGEQFISWIHEKDFIDAIDCILKEPKISSPVNFSSPYPISQKDLMKTLREQWNIPFGLSLGKRELKIASFFTGVHPDLVLKSFRVYPKKLLSYGFEFKYPFWHEACQELVQRA